MSNIFRAWFILIVFITASVFNISVQAQVPEDETILDLVLKQDTSFMAGIPVDEPLINKRFGEDQRTLLTYAIEHDKPVSVMYLLNNGADIEQIDGTKTPLMFAARYGNNDIAMILIEEGADVNIINRDRNTAFHYAAKYNNLDLLKHLYSQGALINIPNEDQWTALDYSIINNRQKTEDYLRSIGCVLFDKNLPDYFDGPYINIIDSGVYQVNYMVNKRGKKGSKIISKNLTSSDNKIEFNGLRKDRSSYTIYPNPAPSPSLYEEAPKIFVMGDIHGQYERLVEMLKTGGVIDKNLDWTWGDGHLVFVGDILDRGEGVTEAYWLIYKLEQEAKKSNGRVHLILGNHEAMIIKNDIRYIANKYYGLTSNLGLRYNELFSQNTILGDWLLSKNCVERIGDIMFIHAGISPDLAKKNMSIEEINRHFRSFLKNPEEKNSDIEKFLISNLGPVWYRGYLRSGSGYDEIDISSLDSILTQYNATRVVVGHTEVDLINPVKNNKIIPVNIPLADESITGQALLIEGGTYYRLSTDKTKTILFNQK